MHRSLWLILVVLAVPAGAAQQPQAPQQTVTVDAQVHAVHAPRELPGTYQVKLEVVTSTDGPRCLCDRTIVWLSTADEAPLTVWRLEPTRYTVDWDQRTNEATLGEHTQRAKLVVHADQTLAQANDTSLTVEVGAYHEGLADRRVLDTTTDPAIVRLGVPGEERDRAVEAAQTAPGPSGQGATSGPDVETASASPAQPVDVDGAAIGTGAGVAGIAMVGLAVRRWYS